MNENINKNWDVGSKFYQEDRLVLEVLGYKAHKDCTDFWEVKLHNIGVYRLFEDFISDPMILQSTECFFNPNDLRECIYPKEYVISISTKHLNAEINRHNLVERSEEKTEEKPDYWLMYSANDGYDNEGQVELEPFTGTLEDLKEYLKEEFEADGEGIYIMTEKPKLLKLKKTVEVIEKN